jgi:aspartate/glutamate racemase
MKTIGILGGMSAASTQTYYRELCNRTRERLGGLHSPELLIRSLDFAVIEALQMAGQWEKAGVILNEEAKALERGGADFIVLATNTMHKLAGQMMQGFLSHSYTLPMLPPPVSSSRVYTHRDSWRPHLLWNNLFTPSGWLRLA